MKREAGKGSEGREREGIKGRRERGTYRKITISLIVLVSGSQLSSVRGVFVQPVDSCNLAYNKRIIT